MTGFISKKELIKQIKNNHLLYAKTQYSGQDLFKKATCCITGIVHGTEALIATFWPELQENIYASTHIQDLKNEEYDGVCALSLSRIIDIMEDQGTSHLAIFVSQHTFYLLNINELKLIDEFIDKPKSCTSITKPEMLLSTDEIKENKLQIEEYRKNQKKVVYKELLDLFWDIQDYNMWEIDECCTLAYVIEKLFKMINGYNVCNQVILEWKELIKENQIPELSVSIANRAMIAIFVDENIKPQDKTHVKVQLDDIKYASKIGIASEFGMIGLQYAPPWFIEIKDEILNLKKQELKQRFFEHARNNHVINAESIYEELYQNDQMLLIELDHYLRHQSFKKRNMLTYENNIGRIVTAEQIHNQHPIAQSIINTYYQFYKMRNNC